ncbi:GPN-loop GTPase family member [Komagataella phaffii CBS 7435]|uniref:GPN-loop GTPase n=2 Tax=Komagataella phaffii TaxID=460519 RepID=C4R681_KOMPG|nr:Essential, conserved, cytoplasmic ATPase [Komagataella phaffii GS115]AOA63349.1 GQ67_04136T0 [Komagataella phaffii]CAH2449094.1 GPN-loop GTPase family member [Komagataella phaffii CBS 7435]AOA68948.1 GQ68_04109T0 [Komagataella phaffii GS115]CAY71067.1 Essential, conserved, cytoplasmic ATPase [Komagataella phaffii GS115]CCA39136.1 GPN-loop GTPase family member [Komagataella phaffii CBS 7435]
MVCTILCIGMAGSGKTTFMQRLNSHLHSKNSPPYVINLDPAVLKVPFGANIDIRDSVNYKKVMHEYNLGPNGAIVTSLNLFSTKIDQVIKLVEKRSDKFQHCIVDTPGQIECFVWSASGAIITEAFASTFPTVIAYIIDTPRNTSPTTFMSNMLYACSILYKTKLPMIIVFNKTDVKKSDFAEEWMTDFEAFQEALASDQELNDESQGSGYMSSLVNSMSLMLEEFYSTLDVASVSSYTGTGFDDFLETIDKKVDEYNEFYKTERDNILKEKEKQDALKKEKSLNHLMKDLGLSKDKKNSNKEEVEVVSDLEDELEVGEDDEAEGLQEPDREYTFAEDRNGDFLDEDIQKRYQDALDATSKTSSSATAENIAKYIRGSQG